MCLTQVIVLVTAQLDWSPWTARDAFVPLPKAEAGSRANPTKCYRAILA